MTNEVSGDAEALAEVLTQALYETETTGGWWGHPECEEFGRLIAPRLAAYVVAERDRAVAEALEALAADFHERSQSHTNQTAAGLAYHHAWQSAANALRAASPTGEWS